MSFVTLAEVIKYAVQREETAYQLYKDAAAKAKTIPAKKLFEQMATEEATHKEVFSKIDLAKAEQHKANKAVDMKIGQYLVDVPLKEDMTYQEILTFAIKAEENAYQLYMAAAEMTEDPDLQKVLRVFADVEKGHKIKVEDIYEEHVLQEM